MDIWRFWKTISSAVKIAVNGRGDIFETQRRNSRAVKFMREKCLEECRLQQLDATAITIYVPVKCIEKGCRKFRILKLANQRKIADYFETVSVDSQEPSSEIVVGDGDLNYFDLAQSCVAGVGSSAADAGENMVAEQVSCAEGEGQGADEDLQAVANFLKANEKLQEPVICNDSSSGSIPLKLERPKPVKKIWPVGRPTTRSSSGARVIKDNHLENEVKSQRAKESRTSATERSIPNIKCSVDNNDLSVETLTFFPNVKQEVLEETEDFNITIVPVGDSVMHIAHNLTSIDGEHTQDTHLMVVKSDPSESTSVPSSETYSHSILSDETMPYRVHVSLPVDEPCQENQESIKDYNIQTDGESQAINQDNRQEFDSAVEVLSPPESVDQSSKHDLTHGHITPRNASDIETIISALEEELKKTGSEIASISVSSDHGCIEDVSASIDEVTVGDIQASYVDSSGQTVHILQGQEIVEVQHVDNVIWTSDGEVQIVEPGQIMDDASAEGGIVSEGQPEQAQYDVVEYEVLADKKQKRGRKRKFKDEPAGEKASLVDRTCPMCHRVLNYASSMTGKYHRAEIKRNYNHYEQLCSSL